MAKYIDLEKAIAEIDKGELLVGNNAEWAKDILLRMPTVDVVEVRHGEWVIKSETTQTLDDVDEVLYVECPFCQRTFYVPFEFEDKKILEYARKHYPYCHCGAKMDKGVTE